MQHESNEAVGDTAGASRKLYVAVGYFKGDETQPADLQAAFNEHLAQPFFQLKLAGYLRDRNGVRRGFMGLLQAEDEARADAFLKSSPYLRAGLYERTEILELDVEVGRLD